MHDDNRYVEFGDMLLKGEIAIHRDKYVKSSFCPTK